METTTQSAISALENPMEKTISMQRAESPSILFVVMTSERNPNYLEGVLKALDKGRVPYLISQGTVGRENLKVVKRGTILTMPNVEFAEGMGVQKRATLNYIHCLRMGASYSYVNTGVNTGVNTVISKPFIILEDDVHLSRNFFPLVNKIYSIYTSHLKTGGRDSIITLYTCYDNLQAREGKIGLLEIPHNTFRGAKAVMFPNFRVALALAELLETTLESTDKNYDVELARHCKSMGIPILMTSMSLVEHIGRVSTGLSDGSHKSVLFVDDVFPENLNSNLQ